MDIRPGQAEPNEFERAILERLARREPSIHTILEGLHVLSREFTGVGSFTQFLCDKSEGGGTRRHLDLNALIHMPTVRNGMGAVLFYEGDQPTMLEVFTYGEDHWDGVYDGFSIEETT